jgi:formate hydrogenlyase transcriptional activator
MLENNGPELNCISTFLDQNNVRSDASPHTASAQNGTSAALKTAVVASALGDGDRILRASEGFLDLLGYTMNELSAGCLGWRQLAPVQSVYLEDLHFDHPASYLVDIPPFQRELVRKDGTRILAEIAAVILQSAPLRWFVTLRPSSLPELQDMPAPSAHGVREGFEEVVGDCPAMKKVLELVNFVAPTDTTALILGESGTGKELMARAIHKLSPRRDKPFITLNCAAVPAGLLESELFGHQRGAFTGAQSQRLGRFELANGGTLFLDEVGDLPVELQPKLLRALQERTIERLGGAQSIPVDVRIIAATNRDLPAMIAAKSFRAELYYRLNVFPITSPALRERGTDLKILISHFTRVHATKMGKTIDQIPGDTMRALLAWPWPGNVRELENFIHRSVILSPKNVLEAPLQDLCEKSSPGNAIETLEEATRRHVLLALKESDGVVTKAARRLGMCRTSLNALMGRMGIKRKQFS